MVRASRGSKVNDHLRDRRGNGVPDDYADSIGHDAESHYVQDTPQRPKD